MNALCLLAGAKVVEKIIPAKKTQKKI